MLAATSEFPHPGSHGFLVGTAYPVRIIQHNADGTCLVQKTGPVVPGEGASRQLRVDAREVVATQELAILAPRRRRKGRG